MGTRRLVVVRPEVLTGGPEARTQISELKALDYLFPHSYDCNDSNPPLPNALGRSIEIRVTSDHFTTAPWLPPTRPQATITPCMKRSLI